MASTKVCVSGVTGFVGSQLAKDLLERGYIVHGTARNISDGKIQYITALPGARENFRAFQGDLLTPGAFDSALDGCSSAFHVASPYFMNSRDPQKELVDPALNGTRHFLESCVKIKSIKKVIVTSSVAAITDEGRKSHIFTEDDWNSKSSLKRLPYYYSKVLAEKFVWNFAEQHPEIKFVVINPFIVVGPSLVPSLNESNAIFKNIVEGKFPAILDFTWTLVDVRDVASAHIAALESSNASGRYICAATENPLKMQTIVHYLRDRGFNVSTVSMNRMKVFSPCRSTT